MTANRTQLFTRLRELGIDTVTVEHAPMFTVEQSQALRGQLPGAHTKNLFLKDKNGRMVLVVAKEDTPIDLKGLASRLKLGRLSFAKPDLLKKILGIEPGAVTPFALINASAGQVDVVVDRALLEFEEVNCHPLENTATTRLKTADLLRFIHACGHEPIILPLG